MMVVCPAMRRVFALAILFLAACEVPTRHGLDETSANEILNALEGAHIGAKKNLAESSGDAPKFVITVNTDDVPRAMELMRSRGLPRIARNGLAETYAQASLVPSSTEERARYLKA